MVELYWGKAESSKHFLDEEMFAVHPGLLVA